MSITAGTNTWRKVEMMVGDRRISQKRKGNVLSSCVTQAYINALETMALTEKQQENVQVREKKNLVRILVGIKRAVERNMDELRVEVGVKERFKKKLVRSSWAGHLGKMGDEKLTKRTDVQKVEGKWRRERRKL